MKLIQRSHSKLLSSKSHICCGLPSLLYFFVSLLLVRFMPGAPTLISFSQKWNTMLCRCYLPFCLHSQEWNVKQCMWFRPEISQSLLVTGRLKSPSSNSLRSEAWTLKAPLSKPRLCKASLCKAQLSKARFLKPRFLLHVLGMGSKFWRHNSVLKAIILEECKKKSIWVDCSLQVCDVKFSFPFTWSVIQAFQWNFRSVLYPAPSLKFLFFHFFRV